MTDYEWYLVNYMDGLISAAEFIERADRIGKGDKAREFVQGLMEYEMRGT